MHPRTHHRIGTFKPQPASRLGAPICNRAMKIPVGSKQRSVWLTPLQLLLERVAKCDSEDSELDRFYEEAARYTIERFEAAGSPVVTDGEQRRYHNFATYCAAMRYAAGPWLIQLQQKS